MKRTLLHWEPVLQLDRRGSSPANNAMQQMVAAALTEIHAKYPFMAYGTDWLAFAHLIIAVAFIGPLRDPVRNIWVVTFGLIACLGVVPLALVAGAIRDIPVYWRLLDCSFGVFGALPLWFARRNIVLLQAIQGGNGV